MWWQLVGCHKFYLWRNALSFKTSLACLSFEGFTLRRLRLTTNELVLLRHGVTAWLTGINLSFSSSSNLSLILSSLVFNFRWIWVCAGFLINWFKCPLLAVSSSVFKFWITVITGECGLDKTFAVERSLISGTFSRLDLSGSSFSESCQTPTSFPKLGPSSLIGRGAGSDPVLWPMKAPLFLICSILFHLPARAILGHADRSPLPFDLLSKCSKLLCLQGFLKLLFRSNGDCTRCNWPLEFISIFDCSTVDCAVSGPSSVSPSHMTSFACFWTVTWRSFAVAVSLERLGAASKWRAFIWMVNSRIKLYPKNLEVTTGHKTSRSRQVRGAETPTCSNLEKLCAKDLFRTSLEL